MKNTLVRLWHSEWRNYEILVSKCWCDKILFNLIDVLKSKFGSIYRIKKQRDSQKITTIEGKIFFWTWKDLSEKANQTLQKIITSLNESWQQKKIVRQVVRLIHIVSFVGSEDWLALNSTPWTVKKSAGTQSATLGT